MSELILKALMQLFAILARPEGSRVDRRTVVELFLRKQLNEELVHEYLQYFDHYFAEYQEKLNKTESRERKIASSSVRILKICTQINEELTLQQKIIVVVQLFEFVSDDEKQISAQELDFINTVADTFNFSTENFHILREFLLSTTFRIPENPYTLLINCEYNYFHPVIKHLFCESLPGHIRVNYIEWGNIYIFRYFGEDELYLNGQLISKYRTYILHSGSSIRSRHIKPIYYSDIVTIFHKEQTTTKIIFEAQELSYIFKNGKVGLQPLSFSEESGKLVGIMGVSGSGKTTLINVLNGNTQPTNGEVLINGINIYTNKDAIQGLIGYVSQDDLLIEDLTVFENLYYNARFCFSNLSDEEIRKRTDKALKNLGLYEIKDIQVGSPLNKKISGGQRKRLNIALELIREPAVLFLDEPTSGLSSRDSENILDLLEELTLKGKLVFVVIHQPSSDIFKMFDRLLLLDQGGYLIYNGDAIDSIMYFKSRIHHANWNESECHACGNVNPDQIFNIIEANVLNEYGRPTGTRKISPFEWYRFFKDYGDQHKHNYVYSDSTPQNLFNIPNKIQQLIVFLLRDVKAKLANLQFLFINFLEAPVLAFILAFLIKYYNISSTTHYHYINNSNIPIYLFMSVIIAIFLGLSVSAEEIIKDRKILKREKFLNLSWFSYLSSKVTILLFISAIQALTFILVGNTILEIKGMYFHYWLVLFSCWSSANIMGLIISDSFKTVVTIYILIPFLVIPQIVLSGIIIRYEKLNPKISSPDAIPLYGELMTARWGYEALATYQFINNKYQKKLYPFNQQMSEAEYKKNYWLPELRNKIEQCINSINKSKDNTFKNNLTLLKNEISAENQDNELIQFTDIDKLSINSVSKKTLENLLKHTDRLNRFYINLYNKNNAIRDSILLSMQAQKAAKESFLNLKNENDNESLTEFVRNSNEIDRIIAYKNKLYRKIDPIYLEPKHPFLKAHFYAPVKFIGNIRISTFWANIFVIWTMWLLLFGILYLRALKRLLDLIEYYISKIKKESD